MRPPLSAFCCKLAHYRCLLTPTEVARYGFYHPFVSCLSVSQHFISKADAARITKLDTKMFQDEFWKSWGQKIKSQGHESKKYCRRGCLHFCERWLLVVYNGGDCGRGDMAAKRASEAAQLLLSICLWSLRSPDQQIPRLCRPHLA